MRERRITWRVLTRSEENFPLLLLPSLLLVTFVFSTGFVVHIHYSKSMNLDFLSPFLQCRGIMCKVVNDLYRIDKYCHSTEPVLYSFYAIMKNVSRLTFSSSKNEHNCRENQTFY